MTNSNLRLSAELRRLREGPHPTEQPTGIGTVRFVARCPVGAASVLRNTSDVLRIVDEAALVGWLTEEQWRDRLPSWFISACASPMTDTEANKWLAWWKNLSPEEQTRTEAEKDWSLDAWLYWMKPENRQWFWWDSRILDGCDHIVVAVEVEAWPFPWGSLRWLFRAAGASALEPEE